MRTPVAVEMGERWLKVVAKPSLRQPQRLVCLVKPIAGLSDEQMTQTLASALKEVRVKPRPLVLCLPRNFVTVRNLHVPSQSLDEIAQMVDLNIVRLVPYRKDQVLSSYQLLGTDEFGYSRVLLAIVQRELIERHLRLVQSTGCSVDRILLSSHGACEWTLSRHRSDLNARDLYLLLDGDAGFSDLVIFSRERLLFSRSLAIEPHHLRDAAGVSKLLTETRQALEIFQTEEVNLRPTKMFLAGSAAHVEELARTIEQALELPVVSVAGPARDTPADLSLSATAAFAAEEGHERLSFILPEVQIRQALKEKTRELLLLGSMGLYVFTVVSGIFLTRMHHQQAYLKALQHRNQAIKQEIGDLVAQSASLELVKRYLNARKLPLVYFGELQRLVPGEIALSQLSIDEQHAGMIRGQALQVSDVFNFITTLEQSDHVDEVTADYTRKKRLKDQEITEFQLKLRVRL